MVSSQKRCPISIIFTNALFIKVLTNVFIHKTNDAKKKYRLFLVLSDAYIVKVPSNFSIIADTLCSLSQLSFGQCSFCIASNVSITNLLFWHSVKL